MAKSKKKNAKKKEKVEVFEVVEVLEVVEEAELDFLSEEGEALEAMEGPELENLDFAEDLTGTELGEFEAADIEDVERLTDEQIVSIIESVLFSTDKPVSVALIKQAFKGTQVKAKDIRDALVKLQEEYAEMRRGFTLEEVANGFQLRTKADNMKYLRQSVKARPFKLSGPALEVLSIVAYKQPTTKAQIDEIRGVESGHLLRALMEKHIVTFGERSELPGKPMYYETTRKFLEIFGLRNLQELPSLTEIDQLIPEGIGDVEEKETLSDLTGKLSQQAGSTYSEGEEELLKITDELSQITTSSEFFEKEKERMREQRDRERAQNIRDAITVGEEVDEKEKRWLERYEAAQLDTARQMEDIAFVTEGLAEDIVPAEVTAEAIEADAAAAQPEEPAREPSVSDLAASAASALGAFADDESGSEPETQV